MLFSTLFNGTEKGHNGPWIAVYYLYWLNTVTNPIVYFLFKLIKGGAKCLKRNRITNCIQGCLLTAKNRLIMLGCDGF